MLPQGPPLARPEFCPPTGSPGRGTSGERTLLCASPGEYSYPTAIRAPRQPAAHAPPSVGGWTSCLLQLRGPPPAVSFLGHYWATAIAPTPVRPEPDGLLAPYRSVARGGATALRPAEHG